MKDTNTVLLVDDEDSHALLIYELLQSDGYIIDKAQTLAQAQVKFRALSPTLVILDLGLPDSQGLETLETALISFVDTPIVVLTGSEQEELAIRSMEKGAEDFCNKSWLHDSQLLPRIVRFAIERYRMRLAEREEMAIRLKRQVASINHFARNAASTVKDVHDLENDNDSRKVLHDLALKYRNLVFDMMELSSYNERQHTESLRQISRQLVSIGAQTHHIIQLHDYALQSDGEKFAPSKQREYLDNAYLTLIELLGHAVNHYRSLSSGS